VENINKKIRMRESSAYRFSMKRYVLISDRIEERVFFIIEGAI
tara:strand:- start:7891 stop:8019 length:129 start_codon:yes stop_codon:yes gene_type:complete